MNIAHLIDRHVPPQLLEFVKGISIEASRQGQKVYLVGGIVRDLLLADVRTRSVLSFDLDLVVEGDAVKLAQQVAGTGHAKLLTHRRFGTAKLRCRDFTLDMATARKETYARPGALPVVAPGILRDDLIRRDFSVNAMAISLAPEDYGELVDPYRGRIDLDHRLIRILHPASFRDDPTRILRGVRYEQRLGFELEAETAHLLRRDIAVLDTISGDRIRHELELIFREERPELAIRRLTELGVLQRISPSLTGDDLMAERFGRARWLKKPAMLPSLYFCLLTYAFSESELEQFLARLNIRTRPSRAMRDTLRLKARLPLLDRPSLKPSEAYHLLHDYNVLAIEANAIAAEPSTVSHQMRLFLTRLRYVRTCLDGEDLRGLGFSAGPEMGRILEALHRAKLDGQVTTRADEERLALSLKTAASHTNPEF